MTSQSRQRRCAKKRIQLSLRTLLVLMLILGPLSGWYGPVIVAHLRDLLADRSTISPANTTNTKSQIQQRLLEETLKLVEQRQTENQAVLARIEAHRRARDAHRRARRQERMAETDRGENPLINRNGTFNMRYHHRPSEQ